MADEGNVDLTLRVTLAIEQFTRGIDQLRGAVQQLANSFQTAMTNMGGAGQAYTQRFVDASNRRKAALQQELDALNQNARAQTGGTQENTRKVEIENELQAIEQVQSAQDVSMRMQQAREDEVAARHRRRLAQSLGDEEAAARESLKIATAQLAQEEEKRIAAGENENDVTRDIANQRAALEGQALIATEALQRQSQAKKWQTERETQERIADLYRMSYDKVRAFDAQELAKRAALKEAYAMGIIETQQELDQKLRALADTEAERRKKVERAVVEDKIKERRKEEVAAANTDAKLARASGNRIALIDAETRKSVALAKEKRDLDKAQLEGAARTTPALNAINQKYREMRKEIRAAAEARKEAFTTEEMDKFGNALQQASFRMAAAGAALTAGLIAALEPAIRLEKMLSAVKAVTAATGTEFDKLRDQAMELGRVTVFTAESVAEGQKFLGQAGFQTGEILASMQAITNLAAAGQLEMARASDITVGILRGYGIAAEDAAGAIDLLAKTVTSANVEMNDLAETMKYVGPVASAAGVDLADVAASAGIVANAGIKGSMAGTALRQSISALIAPTSNQATQLKELGIQIQDTNGNFIGFIPTIREFERVFQDISSEAEKAGIVMKLFGDRAGPSLMALVNQGSEGLERFKEELENSAGVAEEMAETRLENLAGQIMFLQQAFEGLAIKIGTPILSPFRLMLVPLTQIVKKIAELVEWFQQFETVNKVFIASISTALAGAGLTTVLAALALGFATFIKLIVYAKKLAIDYSVAMTGTSAAVGRLGVQLKSTAISFGKGVVPIESMKNALVGLHGRLTGVLPPLNGVALGTNRLTSALHALGGATTTANAGLTTLIGGFARAMGSMVLLTGAITIGYNIWKKYKAAQDEAAANDNIIKAIRNLADEVTRLNNELDEVGARSDAEITFTGIDHTVDQLIEVIAQTRALQKAMDNIARTELGVHAVKFPNDEVAQFEDRLQNARGSLDQFINPRRQEQGVSPFGKMVDDEDIFNIKKALSGLDRMSFLHREVVQAKAEEYLYNNDLAAMNQRQLDFVNSYYDKVTKFPQAAKELQTNLDQIQIQSALRDMQDAREALNGAKDRAEELQKTLDDMGSGPIQLRTALTELAAGAELRQLTERLPELERTFENAFRKLHFKAIDHVQGITTEGFDLLATEARTSILEYTRLLEEGASLDDARVVEAMDRARVASARMNKQMSELGGVIKANKGFLVTQKNAVDQARQAFDEYRSTHAGIVKESSLEEYLESTSTQISEINKVAIRDALESIPHLEDALEEMGITYAGIGKIAQEVQAIQPIDAEELKKTIHDLSQVGEEIKAVKATSLELQKLEEIRAVDAQDHLAAERAIASLRQASSTRQIQAYRNEKTAFEDLVNSNNARLQSVILAEGATVEANKQAITKILKQEHTKYLAMRGELSDYIKSAGTEYEKLTAKVLKESVKLAINASDAAKEIEDAFRFDGAEQTFEEAEVEIKRLEQQYVGLRDARDAAIDRGDDQAAAQYQAEALALQNEIKSVQSSQLQIAYEQGYINQDDLKRLAQTSEIAASMLKNEADLTEQARDRHGAYSSIYGVLNASTGKQIDYEVAQDKINEMAAEKLDADKEELKLLKTNLDYVIQIRNEWDQVNDRRAEFLVGYKEQLGSSAPSIIDDVLALNDTIRSVKADMDAHMNTFRTEQEQAHINLTSKITVIGPKGEITGEVPVLSNDDIVKKESLNHTVTIEADTTSFTTNVKGAADQFLKDLEAIEADIKVRFVLEGGKELTSRAIETLLSGEKSDLRMEVLGFQKGGLIPGFGGGDTVPAFLERGEGILTKEAIRHWGTGIVGFLNSFGGMRMPSIGKMGQQIPMKFREGGIVPGGRGSRSLSISVQDKEFVVYGDENNIDGFIDALENERLTTT